jgi:hypothetical protein
VFYLLDKFPKLFATWTLGCFGFGDELNNVQVFPLGKLGDLGNLGLDG